MGNIYLNLVLRTQAIDYKEKHMQWAASSSEDVSASSGSEGEMDGGGHRAGAGGGGEAEAGAGGGAGAAGRVRVIPRAWGMSQMRDRAGGRPGMTAVMMAITGSHHVWSRQGVRLPGYITTR